MLASCIGTPTGKTPLPPVALFKPGGQHKLPNDAVDADARHWAQFWQKMPQHRDAHTVLNDMRRACVSGLRHDSNPEMFDVPPFSHSDLFSSAKTYKKTSKGSDNWLASEVLLPVPVGSPLSHAIDFSVSLLAWPHQNLLNIHPELGKTGGGPDHLENP